MSDHETNVVRDHCLAMAELHCNDDPGPMYQRTYDAICNLQGETIDLKLQVRQLRDAFDAACAFIDSHVADPDMTHEMVRNYAEFKKHRAYVDPQ